MVWFDDDRKKWVCDTCKKRYPSYEEARKCQDGHR